MPCAARALLNPPLRSRSCAPLSHSGTDAPEPREGGEPIFMKHAASRELYAYWEERRGRRAAPERGDRAWRHSRRAERCLHPLARRGPRPSGPARRYQGMRAVRPRAQRRAVSTALGGGQPDHHRGPARDPRRRTHRAEPWRSFEWCQHTDGTGETRPWRVERQRQEFDIEDIASAVPPGRAGNGARSVRSRSAAAATSARPSKNACSRVSWRRGAAVVSLSTMAAVPSGSFAGTTSVCVNAG
jgi:hypothetical protein